MQGEEVSGAVIAAALPSVSTAETALCKSFLSGQIFVAAEQDNWGKTFPAPYGTPLGPKVDARYEFWPQRKREWTLLFFYATQLLAGAKASTCRN